MARSILEAAGAVVASSSHFVSFQRSPQFALISNILRLAYGQLPRCTEKTAEA